MKNILLTLLLTSSVHAFAKVDQSTQKASVNYSKVATVHGMVCAFCSNSLEKKFKKEKAVKNISVDLENKKVSVEFKKGKSISDEKLKKMITASGFKVVSIDDHKSLKSGKRIDKE
ncbi:MAG: heavy-metal-associated domain-containing protein [Bdellovibrionales bacterium]